MTTEDDWKLMHSPAFDEELREVREIGEHVSFYAQLRFHALEMGRKLGWAAYFYKEYYGEWPDREWEKVAPMRPTENTVKIIEKRDRLFVFEKKKEWQREERRAHEQRVGEGEATGELLSGENGAGGVRED
jgi:hypothetical protein